MGAKKLIFKLFLVSAVISVALALSGGQPGGFLSYGTNARSIGLGRAFLAIADDASAVMINPAGMIQVKNMEASLFQTGLYDGYGLIGFNFIYPQVNNTLGFSFTQLSSQAMDLRDAWNESQGSFTDSQMAVGVSYAQPILIPELSIGVSGKYVNRTLHTHTDSRIIGDTSILFRPFPFLSMGAVIHNLIDFQLGDESKDKFAPLPRAGIAFKDKYLTLAFDIENDLDNWFLGAEYTINEFIILRGGLNYESTNLGFSLAYSAIRFDYALSNDDLGMNHRFSFNLGIGQLINNFQKDASVDWNQLATEKYNDGFFLFALEDMKKAYILNPNNKEIQEKLERLKKIEDIGDKLNLDIRVEKQVWPKYKQAKDALTREDYESSYRIAKEALKQYPSNPNVLKLIEKIEKTGKIKK
ncbi:MAG: hypothetical protein PHF25_06620 [Candidatus Margulisbacteria bacterium]|nr:hypothetical protein [Candidatus Margulisiibacteriota bacterium]